MSAGYVLKHMIHCAFGWVTLAVVSPPSCCSCRVGCRPVGQPTTQWLFAVCISALLIVRIIVCVWDVQDLESSCSCLDKPLYHHALMYTVSNVYKIVILGELLEYFEIRTGVRKHDRLSPIIFKSYFGKITSEIAETKSEQKFINQSNRVEPTLKYYILAI